MADQISVKAIICVSALSGVFGYGLYHFSKKLIEAIRQKEAI